jgi:hypothetical protein
MYYLVDDTTSNVMLVSGYPIPSPIGTSLVQSDLTFDVVPSHLVYDRTTNQIRMRSGSEVFKSTSNAKKEAAASEALSAQQVDLLKKKISELPPDTKDVFTLLLNVLGI